jgi:hypothetical protein
MTKINDGAGGAKPPKDFNLEDEILKGVFKDDVDNVRGETIGVESLRAINQQFDTGGRDVFDAPKVDIGADPKPEPEKLRQNLNGPRFTLVSNRLWQFHSNLYF